MSPVKGLAFLHLPSSHNQGQLLCVFLGSAPRALFLGPPDLKISSHLLGLSLNPGFKCSLLCIYLAVPGLHYCTDLFSGCGNGGSSLVAVHRLIVEASLVAEHRL